MRPKLQPKESSSSTTTTGTTLSSSPSTPVSATSAGAKSRMQFDNFYSLEDPYKTLKHDEPTDFFNAVTQSDLATIERMLKLFPALIHESNGFWPHPTPILVAARSKNAIETMRVLIQYGAALDRGDHNGTTVLHFVCEQYGNPIEAIQFLLKAGADCNARDAKKRTPLMVLIQNTHIGATKVLIDAMRCLFKAGAQTKVSDHQCARTPLHYAIMHCKEAAPVMELLLKKGADVNARDYRKSTCLHMVLEKMDNQEIVQMMLLYGADPGLRNGNKRNALGVAAENLRVLSAWFLLENDLLSSAPDSLKKASELCSKAEGPDKNAKPLLKNTLLDWQGKDGKLKRIQLAQDCVFKVQRTPDMKTVDQTQVALEFLESCGQPVHQQLHQMNTYGTNSNPNHTSSSNSR
jgi:ankyrin repeat protein